jgi:hypothetical protein
MLIFPDFNKGFEIHMDISDYQLGSVIRQDQKPIAFYSKKLTATQRNYTVGEREMLSIVKILNEFHSMLLGHLKIYTNHKNQINSMTVSKSPQIQRWQWTIEEFGPDFEYINGPRNVVADALSRLDIEMFHSKLNSDAIPELFKNANDKSLNIDYPLSTAVITKHQQKDTTLVRHIKPHPEYFIKRVDSHNVILLNNKMNIPTTLRKEIL